eukprot:7385066-Ditylum_brightwellii.AAC.1
MTPWQAPTFRCVPPTKGHSTTPPGLHITCTGCTIGPEKAQLTSYLLPSHPPSAHSLPPTLMPDTL